MEESPPKKSRGEKRRDVASRGRSPLLLATNDAEDGHDEAGVSPPTETQPAVSLAPESDQRQRQAKNQQKYNLNLEVSKAAVESALKPSRLRDPSDRVNAAANYSQHATTRG